MAVLVAKGVCPECAHEEYPIRHTDCFAAWVKQNGSWCCYGCEKDGGRGSINCICDNCGKRYSNTQTVKWSGDMDELSN